MSGAFNISNKCRCLEHYVSLKLLPFKIQSCIYLDFLTCITFKIFLLINNNSLTRYSQINVLFYKLLPIIDEE